MFFFSAAAQKKGICSNKMPVAKAKSRQRNKKNEKNNKIIQI